MKDFLEDEDIPKARTDFTKLIASVLALALVGGGVWLVLRQRTATKQDMALRLGLAYLQELVKPHETIFALGLTMSPKTMDTRERMAIASLVRKDKLLRYRGYLDGKGVIRWHPDARMIGKGLDDFLNEYEPQYRTDAVKKAFKTRQIAHRPVPGSDFYEVALPFVSEDKVLGMLVVWVPG